MWLRRLRSKPAALDIKVDFILIKLCREENEALPMGKRINLIRIRDLGGSYVDTQSQEVLFDSHYFESAQKIKYCRSAVFRFT